MTVVMPMVMIVPVMMTVVVSMVVATPAGVAMIVVVLGVAVVTVADGGDLQKIVGAVVVGMVVPMTFVGATLGLEGPRDTLHRATEPAHHLGQHVVVADVEGVIADLGRGMAIADMPRDLGEAGRRLSAHLEEILRRGDHLDQTAILELECIATLDGCHLVQVEQKLGALVALERDTSAMAPLVIEGDGVDNLVGFDGEPANDGGGAEHDGPR